MRIHSNALTSLDIYRATNALPGVYAEVTPKGSRTHVGAFEIRLTGTSTRRTMDGQDQAATWDEWGVFIAAIYEVDPAAVFGSVKSPNYRDSNHFHAVTRYRFDADALPEDTHQQHNWRFNGAVNECTKCSASFDRSAA